MELTEKNIDIDDRVIKFIAAAYGFMRNASNFVFMGFGVLRE